MIDRNWRNRGVASENLFEDAEIFQSDSEGFVRELGKKPDSYEDIEGQYTGLIKVAGRKTMT